MWAHFRSSKTRCANLAEGDFRGSDQGFALSSAATENREHPQNKPADCKTSFPVIVAEWPRNRRETIRVSLDEYQGRTTIDCRAWWHDGDGELKPGKAGLTLAVKHLPALAEAIGRALVRAQDLGLLNDGGEQ
jgi:hypothetical protein